MLNSPKIDGVAGAGCNWTQMVWTLQSNESIPAPGTKKRDILVLHRLSELLTVPIIWVLICC